MSIVIPGFNDKPIGGWSNNKGSNDMSTTTTGGFTPTQLQLMDDLYGLYNNLPDSYVKYGGKRYEDFTDREKELLAKEQEIQIKKSQRRKTDYQLSFALDVISGLNIYGIND